MKKIWMSLLALVLTLLVSSCLVLAEETTTSPDDQTTTTAPIVTTTAPEEPSSEEGETTTTTQEEQPLVTTTEPDVTTAATKKPTWTLPTTNPKDTNFYELTVTAGENGSVNGNPSGSHRAGTKISLVAVPNEGYVFEKWVSDQGLLLDAYSAETEFYMPSGNAKVKAFFVKQGTVTVPGQTTTTTAPSANAPAKGGGSISPAAIVVILLVVIALGLQVFFLWKDYKKIQQEDGR